MNMIEITSTNLVAVGHDPATEELEVHFRNGLKYRYSRVPVDIFKGLLAAASKGAFFNQRIKDRFPFRKLL